MSAPRWRPHTDRLGRPKVRYLDEPAAVAAAQDLAAQDLADGTAFRRTPVAYPCSDAGCGGWHVGNWSDEAYRSRPA